MWLDRKIKRRIKYECEKDKDDDGMSQRNTRCENSCKWASPKISKEVQISGSMDYR